MFILLFNLDKDNDQNSNNGIESALICQKLSTIYQFLSKLVIDMSQNIIIENIDKQYEGISRQFFKLSLFQVLYNSCRKLLILKELLNHNIWNELIQFPTPWTW